MIILNHTEAAAKKAEHGISKRQSWAFRKGGSFTVMTLKNNMQIIEVLDPAKLTDAEKKEIIAACESIKPRVAQPSAPEPLNSQPATLN